VWNIRIGELSEIPILHLDREERTSLLIKAAWSRTVRNMSRAEWRAYMGDEPYRETYPGKPIPGE
jgi:hypothetical protein